MRVLRKSLRSSKSSSKSSPNVLRKVKSIDHSIIHPNANEFLVFMKQYKKYFGTPEHLLEKRYRDLSKLAKICNDASGDEVVIKETSDYRDYFMQILSFFDDSRKHKMYANSYVEKKKQTALDVLLSSYKKSDMDELMLYGYTIFSKVLKDADKNFIKEKATKLIKEFVRKTTEDYISEKGKRIVVLLALIGVCFSKYDPIKGLHDLGVSIVDKTFSEDEFDDLISNDNEDKHINEQILSHMINHHKISNDKYKYAVRNLTRHHDYLLLSKDQKKKYDSKIQKMLRDALLWM